MTTLRIKQRDGGRREYQLSARAQCIQLTSPAGTEYTLECRVSWDRVYYSPECSGVWYRTIKEARQATGVA